MAAEQSTTNNAIEQGTERSLSDKRRLEDSINDAARGILNTIGNVTITPSAATTTVTHYGVSKTSAVFLMPTDATTALEYGLGTTFVTPAKGSFVITHPNNANVRLYRYVFLSGIRL